MWKFKCYALKANSNHLSIMHLNTQCMTSSSGEFSLSMNSYNFNVVTVSETWLKDNPLLLQHVIFLCLYTSCVTRIEICAKGFGVAAYINDSVIYKRRKDIENLQPEFGHL